VTRGTLVLVGHSVRRVRAMVLGLGLLLAGFQFLLTQVAAYLVRRSAFGQLALLIPDFVRSVAGPSALAFMSFSGVVGLGYFHPIVIAAVLALTIVIASEPAAEVETRFVDLTLSRELGRTDLVTRTVLVFAIAAAFVLGVMAAGTWVGLTCCTPADVPRPSARTIASLAVSLGTVMTCWAGVALAAAAFARRRAPVGGVVGVAALGAYLLDYLGRAWDPARRLSALSPFHYFEPTSLVMGEPLRLYNVMVLAGIGIVGTAIAYAAFSRRDI
jgi:beta-exotoxin I transport system permease protein